MAALPPALVAGCFLVACLTALVLMVYIAWRGSKPSGFFSEAVSSTYVLELPEAEINTYYDLKERLYGSLPEDPAAEAAAAEGIEGGLVSWTRRLSNDDRSSLQQALMKRLVKGIERLDQVQRDKPGNWKLWRGKLVSERFWASLCDAERLIGEEIDNCLAEAEELEPGPPPWREQIFQQAVHIWRMERQRSVEKKVQKKQVEQVKKQKEKEERRKVVEVKLAEEEKLRQERLAEKAMEKLLKEEESMSSKKDKTKGKEKAAPKPKAKKK